MVRCWTRPVAGVLLAVALSAAGCTAPNTRESIGIPDVEGSLGARVYLGIYNRSASADRMGYWLESAGYTSWSSLGVSGRGCSAVTVPWTISIGAADPDGAVGEYTDLLSSDDVDDPRTAVIWIDVANDGHATWGEGRPDWADRGLTCGP